MGWSLPRLAGQSHAENVRGNRENDVDDRERWRGWKRACREVGQIREADIELTKRRGWRIAISDRRMGHSCRKTKRYWKSAREELGRAEDRRRVGPGVVARVEVEDHRIADHRQAYPGLWFRGEMWGRVTEGDEIFKFLERGE